MGRREVGGAAAGGVGRGFGGVGGGAGRGTVGGATLQQQKKKKNTKRNNFLLVSLQSDTFSFPPAFASFLLLPPPTLPLPPPSSPLALPNSRHHTQSIDPDKCLGFCTITQPIKTSDWQVWLAAPGAGGPTRQRGRTGHSLGRRRRRHGGRRRGDFNLQPAALESQ